jgi:hypothetical protein
MLVGFTSRITTPMSRYPNRVPLLAPRMVRGGHRSSWRIGGFAVLK